MTEARLRMHSKQNFNKFSYESMRGSFLLMMLSDTLSGCRSLHRRLIDVVRKALLVALNIPLHHSYEISQTFMWWVYCRI